MKPGVAYTSIEAQYPYVLRGTNQQTQTGLLWTPPSSRLYGSVPGDVTTVYGPGMALGSFALHNRSGGAVAVAIGVRIPNYLWKAGQWTDSTTTFTDDTTDAQSTTTADFPMETTTNNDGHVILSRVPFNAVSYNISTASVDATNPARALRFSNAAGTGWQTAETAAAFGFVLTGATVAEEIATGEAVVAFPPPVDWGKSSSLATNLPNGYYAMNMRATTAPDTTAAVATCMEIFRMYYMTEGVADAASFSEQFAMGEFVMASDATEGLYGDALVALFSTADDGNRVTAQVRAV